MHYSNWSHVALSFIFKYEMPFVVIKIICLSHELFKLHAHVFLSGRTHLFYMLGPFILKNVITNTFYHTFFIP
jgi:hypothetical protein